MSMKSVTTIVKEIEDFLLERGGYNYFKIGKSSQNEKEIAQRYENNEDNENKDKWKGSVSMKILNTGTKELRKISMLESKVIKIIQDYDWGLYMRNKTTASSGNDKADQLYVFVKETLQI